MGVWEQMIKHPFVVKLDVHTAGYEKAVTLTGEARTEDEAITMALLAESCTELEPHPVAVNGHIDDVFTYIVSHVHQISHDEHVVLKKYIGGW